MKIIAFTGAMGSGKSTAINELKKIIGGQSANIKFAQPLYDIQEMIYRRISGVYQRPESFIKDRKLLQWLGTDWGRTTISDTVWVDLWKHQVALVKSLQQNVSLITCDDVRFDNEAEAVKSVGGYVIQVTRADRTPDGGEGIKAHASEAGLSSEHVDFILPNNGSIQELRDNLNNIMLIVNQTV